MTNNTKHVHCIGVGGIGVSALAELMLYQGHTVTGSDVAENDQTTYLKNLGMRIFIGHHERNISSDLDLIVYSSAIKKNNPEWIQAVAKHIPLVSRGQMLSQLVRSYETIAVAGAHGKTTTTGMVAHVLECAQLDPLCLIGSILHNQKSPMRFGIGPYCVAEADESDGSFLKLRKKYAIVTNVDRDHLENYGNSYEHLKNSFVEFLNTIPDDGCAFLCLDDPELQSLIPHLSCPVVTYGFHPQAQFRAGHNHQTGLMNYFDAPCGLNGCTTHFELSAPGQHNIQNALSVLALSLALHIPIDVIQQALRHFPGLHRRFEYHGKIMFNKKRIDLIGDYGHHPKEIQVTLEAARSAFPQQRVVLVFQPHRFTRTLDLHENFAQILTQPDQLYLLDIYSAGDSEIPGVDSLRLMQSIHNRRSGFGRYIASSESLSDALSSEIQDQDVLIFQGAGNINSMLYDFKKYGSH